MSLKHSPARMSNRLAFGISDACEATGLGRSFIYEEIKAGRLLCFKAGSRTLIAAEDLRAWLDARRNGGNTNVAA